MPVLSPSLVRMEKPLNDCIQTINELGCESVHIDIAKDMKLPQFFSLQAAEENARKFNARVTLHIFQGPNETTINFGFLRHNDLALLHIFQDTSGGQIESFLEKVKKAGCLAGLAIDLSVPPSIFEPYLKDLHIVFVVGIPAATHGLLPDDSTESRLAEVRRIFNVNKSRCRLGLDGGVNAATFPRFAGLADELVVGGLLFHSSNVVHQWQSLKKIANGVEREHQYKKYFIDEKKAKKEVAILRFMANFEMRDLIPCLDNFENQQGAFVVATSILPGKTLTKNILNSGMMISLGKIVKSINSIGTYDAFGLLNDGLDVQQPFQNFSSFLRWQILKWQNRLDSNDVYILEYASWLMRELSFLEDVLNECRPVFCHGDFDFKNILAEKNIITGLVDWEHAGIFCVEWELRKLSRYCNEKNGFLKSFFIGYYGSLPHNYEVKKRVIKYIEAADILGHLGWCKRSGNVEEYEETKERMKDFLHS